MSYSQRRDPAKCRNQIHNWVPENLFKKMDGNGNVTDACRPCRRAAEARTRAKSRMLEPVKNPVRRRGADVAEDYTELRALGYHLDEIAVRLSMTKEALQRSLQRSGTPQ